MDEMDIFSNGWKLQNFYNLLHFQSNSILAEYFEHWVIKHIHSQIYRTLLRMLNKDQKQSIRPISLWRFGFDRKLIGRALRPYFICDLFSYFSILLQWHSRSVKQSNFVIINF